MALWLQAAMPSEELTSLSSSALDYVKLIFVLSAILILAYVTVRHVIPRFLGMNNSPGGPIQVLARFPLEPKKTLYAVKAGADVFLIGSSESGMQFLKDLNPADFQSMVRQINEVPTGQFAKVLGNLRGRKISS